jgi:hypothetical protein
VTARRQIQGDCAARDHGHDFEEMLRAADRLDHHAHLLRRLHDSEFGQHWRHESTQLAAPDRHPVRSLGGSASAARCGGLTYEQLVERR